MKQFLSLVTFFLSANFMLVAQNEPNDCVNAVVVCGNANINSNANGAGNVQEISNSCGGREYNSLWLKINVAQSGTLGFDLIPDDTNITVDYDFYVFGPNRSCNNLGNTIRCATTNPFSANQSNNHTGMNGTATATKIGPGADGNSYVRWLNVTAGDFYYIVIDRPIGNGGFSLNWTGTATQGSGAFSVPPFANNIGEYRVCGNNNNVGVFDLDSKRSDINSDLTNNVITFHKSLSDAVDGLNPLPNTTSGIDGEKIYVKVLSTTTGCSSLTEFVLRVNETLDASIALSPSEVCEGETTNVFFSGTPNAKIQYNIDGGASKTLILDNLGKANISTDPLTKNTTYNLTKVISSNTLECFNDITKSVTINVSPKPIVSYVDEFGGTICTETQTLINLSSTIPNSNFVWKVLKATNVYGAVDGTGNIINSKLSLIDTSIDGQVEYSTVANANNCFSDPITIIVNVIKAPLKPVVKTIEATCSEVSKSIIENFDSTLNYTFNPPGPTIGAMGIINGAVAGTKYTITVGAKCTETTEFVNNVGLNIPTASIATNFSTICEGNTVNITFTGTPNANVNYTVNDGATKTIQLDANGKFNLSTPALKTNTKYSLVSVSSNTLPYCSKSVSDSVLITVNPYPIDVQNFTEVICSGNFTAINLKTNGFKNSTFEWTVDTTGLALGASNGSETAKEDNDVVIAQQLIEPSNTVATVVYTITQISESGCKGKPFTVAVLVNPAPFPILNNGNICIGSNGIVLNAGNFSNDFNFEWYRNGVLISGANNSTYTVTQGGEYYVALNSNLIQCSGTSNTITINETVPATNIETTVTNAFNNNATITVNVIGGDGTFSYQLDDNSQQKSNIFEGVSAGSHIITVTDMQGCTYLTNSISVIDYPKYFTPNGDGINDNWNIIGLQDQQEAKIMIFNRYGKLIKEISSQGLGWDGTYNGKLLPAEDYWFSVVYSEEGVSKIFKAHFSLKR